MKLSEVLEGLSHSHLSVEMLMDLKDDGYDVQDNGNQIVVKYGDKAVVSTLHDFDYRFDMHKRYDLCLTVLREHKDDDRIEVRDKDTDELIGYYDPKDDIIVQSDPDSPAIDAAYANIYLVVKHESQVPMFGGWIVDNDENRNARTVNVADFTASACRTFCDDDPGAMFMGRGFAHNARIDLLKKWEGSNVL